MFVKILLLFTGHVAAQSSASDIVIAKGEQKEMNVQGLKNFSVGNTEVISYRYLSKTGKLLIKGKRVGFTDLMIWTKTGKQTMGVYVLSKQKFLKTFQLGDALKNLNLTIDIKGPVITASGELREFADYLYLQKIKGQFQSQVFFKISLHPTLRNHIIGQIYKKLFANGFSSVSCQADWMDVFCFYEGSENEALLKQLSAFYQVTFTRQDSRQRHKNFVLKLKLIQVERLDGREIHFGLDKLQANLADLFSSGIKSLVENNLVFLNQSRSELSTLAEPELVVNLHSPQLIEIGSQIPFQNIRSKGNQVIAPIDWKFAGLRIKTKLAESYGKLLLDYETEFTRPVDQTITGNKEMSSVLLEPGVPMKIFQIGFQTTTKDRSGIPIIRMLFESKSDQKTYKQLYGYVVLEEN